MHMPLSCSGSYSLLLTVSTSKSLLRYLAAKRAALQSGDLMLLICGRRKHPNPTGCNIYYTSTDSNRLKLTGWNY
jgi:hypothetical protein